MLHRIATVASVCVLLPVLGSSTLALADPPTDPAVVPAGNPAPPAPDAAAPPAPGGPAGPVPSAAPGVLTTPDGWQVIVSGKDDD